MKNFLFLIVMLSLMLTAVCVLGEKLSFLHSSSLLRKLYKTKKTNQSYCSKDERTFVVATISGISFFYFRFLDLY